MICGIDEAGRGPVIGPMVVAGVVVEDEEKLLKLGIKDSKRLPPSTRKKLAVEIKKVARDYRVEIIPPSVIDELRKRKTLNEIEKDYFLKVMEKLRADVYYIDAVDVNEERIATELSSKLPFRAKVIAKHHADAIFPVVGAASIIAKTERDEQIEKIAKELEPILGMPIGSGYPADPITRRFLEEWIKRFKSLPPCIRKTWKTLKRFYNETIV